MKWQVTDMNDVVVQDVQQSVVKHTAEALFTFSCREVRTSSYRSGMNFCVRVFRLGMAYIGLRAWQKFLNPTSSTMAKGWKSLATILANSSSIALCLAGVNDFCRNYFMELWVVDAGGWAAGWDVEIEAVIADAEGAVVLAPEKAAAVALVL